MRPILHLANLLMPIRLCTEPTTLAEVADELSAGRPVHPDDRAEVEKENARLFAGEAVSRTYRFRGADGRWVWLHDRVHPEVDKQGRVVALHGVTTNGTALMMRQTEDSILHAAWETLARHESGEALERGAELLAEHLPVDVVGLLLWEPGQSGFRCRRQWVRPEAAENVESKVRALYGEGDAALPLGVNSYVDVVLETGEPLYVPDTAEGAYWGDEERARHGWRSCLALPLLLRDSLRALLLFQSLTPDALSERERLLLERTIPTFAATVDAWRQERELEDLNAALADRVEQRTYELQVLYELAQQFGHTLNYDELFRLMVEQLHRVVDYDVVATKLIVEETETLGMFLVGAEAEGAFTEEQLRLLYTVANQASVSIQRLRALFERQRQRVQDILEQLPEGILLLDADMTLTLCNPVGRRQLSLLGDIPLGQRLARLGETPLSSLLEPDPHGRGWHEVRLTEPDARVFEVTAQRLQDGEGAGGWTLVVRDATRAREVEDKVQGQARLAAVGQLSAGIAHDFNNLLMSAEEEAKDRDEETRAPIPRGHGETIPAVEDEPLVLDTLREMLTTLGYVVLTAGNGEEALEVYAEHREEIGLVVSDMVMPTMGGKELCQRLRAQSPDLRVFILTGYPLGEKEQARLPEGIVGWLQKPPGLRALAEAIRKGLG